MKKIGFAIIIIALFVILSINVFADISSYPAVPEICGDTWIIMKSASNNTVLISGGTMYYDTVTSKIRFSGGATYRYYNKTSSDSNWVFFTSWAYGAGDEFGVPYQIDTYFESTYDVLTQTGALYKAKTVNLASNADFTNYTDDVELMTGDLLSHAIEVGITFENMAEARVKIKMTSNGIWPEFGVWFNSVLDGTVAENIIIWDEVYNTTFENLDTDNYRILFAEDIPQVNKGIYKIIVETMEGDVVSTVLYGVQTDFVGIQINGVEDGRDYQYKPYPIIYKFNDSTKYGVYLNNVLIYTFGTSENQTYVVDRTKIKVGTNILEVKNIQTGVIQDYKIFQVINDTGGGIVDVNPPDDITGGIEPPIVPTGSDVWDWILYYIMRIFYFISYPFVKIIELLSQLTTLFSNLNYALVTGYTSVMALFGTIMSAMPVEWIFVGTLAMALFTFLMVVKR